MRPNRYRIMASATPSTSQPAVGDGSDPGMSGGGESGDEGAVEVEEGTETGSSRTGGDLREGG